MITKLSLVYYSVEMNNKAAPASGPKKPSAADIFGDDDDDEDFELQMKSKLQKQKRKKPRNDDSTEKKERRIKKKSRLISAK